VITLQDRARGAFIGLAVGDALGSPTEGKTPEEISSRWGRVTDFLTDDQGGSDDTEYALFSSKLLLEHRSDLTSAIIAETYRKDIISATNTYKGAGFSEIIAIANLSKDMQPPDSGKHLHSWSDGLAMRVTPYGIANVGDPLYAAYLAAQDGAVTNAGEGIFSGQAVAAAIAAAMAGAGFEKIAEAALEVIPQNSWTASSIKRGISIGKSYDDVWSALKQLHTSIACSYYYWSDIAPEALGLAFGILAAAKGEFENSVLGAVNIGRDTDTIAAITGAISGASSGIQLIPERWIKRITVSRGICISAVKGMNIITAADKLAELAEAWRKK
jgi:ADP-ribosylglycohydrolase